MNRFISIYLTITCILTAFVAFKHFSSHLSTGAPPSDVTESEIPDSPYTLLNNWVRPDGPPRVGLQVGHWRNEELPDELERLRGNTGAQAAGYMEWQVNYDIALKTQEILQPQGIIVDIIPSTVPPAYWADAFIAIHADGSEDTRTSGFKVAGPYRDFTRTGNDLIQYIEASYQQSTGLRIDPNITRNMRGYYAFSWWRNQHAIHPMTTAAILETGFLTSSQDRRIIIDNSELAAQGLAQGIIEYLHSQSLI